MFLVPSFVFPFAAAGNGLRQQGRQHEKPTVRHDNPLGFPPLGGVHRSARILGRLHQDVYKRQAVPRGSAKPVFSGFNPFLPID